MPENRVLLRGIKHVQGAWWIDSASYRRAGNRYVPGPRLNVATAWYATQDEGDAHAAAMNACSASALAYAAYEYETANHKPDQFPRMAHHACAAGFAAVVFFSEAFFHEPPPPGAQERTAVFQSTPSGWAFGGVADALELGQFGIPSEAYTQITAALAAASGEDNVSF
jgi:hypothetical protein